ncbi:MAG: hypothetical protein JO306_04340 [Gemmatimonadetes bacterium]|nr:hypothetical protein [Gemmatimonadota bacterium]
MQILLPLHRRERNWYGSRSAPTGPLRHPLPPAEPASVVPALRIAPLPAQVRQAPVDRRLTDLL